jgi:hypothetical protein
MPIILASWEAEIRRIIVLSQPGQIAYEISISKIIKAKWTEGVAQAVKCLICKGSPEYQTSVPSKKKKKKILGTQILASTKYWEK